jgi:glutathione S-transferase
MMFDPSGSTRLAMLQLYIANKNYSSWSLRAWVLLRGLGMPFAEHLRPFDPLDKFTDFSPSGMVPCLVDGETVVWDSLAIAEYLAEQQPGIWPADAAARAWARCAAAEMHSGFFALRERCGMNCGLRVRLHDFPDTLRRDVARVDALWCQGLARFGGPWLGGAAFSAVDAFFAPVAFRVQTYGLHLSPAAATYAAQLLELPAMAEWYDAALREPWRDAEHENDINRYGAILADQRSTPAP